MKRDLYSEVSARIVAELEAGAAPWVKPWSATPGANTPCNAMSNRPYSGCNVVLLWMAQAAGYRTPRFLAFKQALESGGNVRKGERGTKVYFVKQLQVRDKGADDSSSTRLVPMLREYTVFNVDQCENLPDSINMGKPVRVRNPDTRDELADAFLHSTGADIREGHGEAFYVPSRDFISMPAFEAFKGADHFYNDSGVLTAPSGGADNSSDVDRFGEIGSHIWSTIYLTIRGGRLGVLKSGLVLAAGVAGPRNRRAGLSRSRIARERLFRRWRDGTRSVLSICLRGAKQHERDYLCSRMKKS